MKNIERKREIAPTQQFLRFSQYHFVFSLYPFETVQNLSPDNGSVSL